MVTRGRGLGALLNAVAVGLAGAVLGASGPVPLSPGGTAPGGTEGAPLLAHSCPLFSWTTAAGARGYQLAVYQLLGPPADSAGGAEERTGETEQTEWRLAWKEELPGATSSWTPPLDRALQPGGTYAWAVRALDEWGEGQWSPGRYFEVAAAPSLREVASLLDQVRQRSVQLVAPPETVGPAPRVAIAAQPMARPAAKSRFQERSPSPHPLPLAASSLPGGSSGLHGELPAAGGVTYGVVGVSHTVAGPGLAADNSTGGADLLLAGPKSGLTMTEAGIRLAAPVHGTFDLHNSLGGGLSLEVNGDEVFHAGNDGSGSGLNADLLDNLSAASLLRSSGGEVFDGDTLTFDPGSRLRLDGGAENSPALFVVGDFDTGVFQGAPFSITIGGQERLGIGGNLSFPALELRYLGWDTLDSRLELNAPMALGGSLQAATGLTTHTGYNRFGPETAFHPELTSWSDVFVSEDAEVGAHVFAETTLQVGTTVSTVDYNRFSFDTADHGEVASKADVFISGDLEVNGTIFIDGGYGCGFYALANFCPAGNVDGENCDDVPAGSYCESDGECMLPEANNCGGFDWWFRRLND